MCSSSVGECAGGDETSASNLELSNKVFPLEEHQLEGMVVEEGRLKGRKSFSYSEQASGFGKQCFMGVPSVESAVSMDMDLLRAPSRVRRFCFIGLFRVTEDLLEFREAGSILAPAKKVVSRDWA